MRKIHPGVAMKVEFRNMVLKPPKKERRSGERPGYSFGIRQIWKLVILAQCSRSGDP